MQTEVADRNRQQMLAYREMTDDDLFTTQWVKVETASKNSGYKDERIVCVTAKKNQLPPRSPSRGQSALLSLASA